nr:putative Ig domain-containing protein [uncultured Kingella sp.]
MDSLADTLNTVATRTGTGNQEERLMLAAQAAEWFYFQAKDYQYNGSAFFKNTANGVLQYTAAWGENYDGQKEANTDEKGKTVVKDHKSDKYTEAWIKQIFAANGLSGQAVRWRGWQQWTLATNATASSAWALDADKSQIMVGAEGNDAFSGGNGDDLLIGGAGNDTLSGMGGHNVLAGGAGEDTYFITTGSSNTIIDADGAGSILWNGMRLTGESKADGENRWVDAGRNITYYMLDNDLYISHFSPTSAFGIRIAGWKEGALGLHLGSEPAERSHYTRILGDWQPRLTDAGTYAPLGERLADGSLKGGVHKENGFDDVIDAPRANTPYHIEGGKGDDALGGNTGNDLIEGGEGRDLIAGGGGSDILAGGGGDDFIFAASRLNAAPRRSPDERWTLPPRQRGRIAFAGRTWGQVEEKGGDNPAYTMYGIGRPFNEPQGTAGDRIYGGDGSDSIYAGNTDDYIAADSEYTENGHAISGTGNDDVFAGGGNDTVLGGGGKDLIWGDGLVEAGNINSVAPEMHGHDTIDAGEGDDKVYGGGGNDFIQGGSGNDRLFGDSAFVQPEEILPVKFHGTDEIHGGSGSDWIIGGGGDDFLYGDEGDDFLFGDANDDNPYPELNGRDYIDGGSGDDQASGGYGDDEIHGGEGDDKLFGNAGSDTMFGGEGNDLIRGDGEVGLQNGADDGADTLHGGRGNDNITGDGGNDLLYGDEDNDTVYGGAGNDTLYGGEGDDTLIGDNSGQIPEEDLGIPAESGRDDTLYGGNGDDQLMGGIGNDTLYGGEGNDKLWGDLGLHRDHHPEGFAGDDVLDGGAGDDYLDGGRGNDLLYGGEGSDMLSGGNGNDRLYGGEGSDLLDGGEGDDLLYGGAGGDELDGGTGQDRLEGGAGNDIYRYHTGDGTTTIADREGQSAILLDSLQELSFEEYENGIAIRNGKAGDVLYLEGYHTAQSGKASADLENVFLYEQSLNGNWISLADIEEQIRQPAAPAAANTAPQVLHPAEAYTARAGTPFSYTLPENWFADREDAALAYGLAAADGSPLPNWLHYDPATRTLSGTPPEQVSGSLKLTVTATDSGGLTAAQDWMFSVQGKYPAALGSAYNVIRGSQIASKHSARLYADHIQIQEDGTRTILSHQGSDAMKMHRNAEGGWDTERIRNADLPENPVLHGTDGADSLKGQSSLLPWGSEIRGHGGNDTLYGSNKADLLFGGDGDDGILGYDGSDTLFGGRGNDRLNGGAGGDTYIFTKGDGQDTVTERPDSAETNRAVFADRQLSEMVLGREGNDLSVSASRSRDRVTFKNFFGTAGYGHDLFLFQDAAVTGADIAAALGGADLMVQAMSSFGTDAAAASSEHTRQPETPNMLLAAGSLS